ncbi:hypothetical protein GCM10022200_22850 [Microbacterium awajiense]|uniref:Uncharacterized protein n=1 Tax=Microbacterium awajiense TaxID=415214 RepID=A0ABP7AS89_9MICO
MNAKGLTAVAGWLAEYGQTVVSTDEGLDLADGEVELRVRRRADGWIVHKVWRDQDRGVVFAASDATDVDRYLALTSANEVRARLGLPRSRHGVQTDADGIAMPADGFVLTGDLKAGFVLTHGATGRAWRFASDIEASRFSRYASTPPDLLRRAITSPHPDFGDARNR